MSDHHRCLDQLRLLTSIGPLSDLFAYGPEIGWLMRRLDPALWGVFKDEDPTWRPAQADHLAFLAYLETLPDLDIAPLIASTVAGVSHLDNELRNSLRWESSERMALPEDPIRLRLRCPAMSVYAPPACLARPDLHPEMAWAADMLGDCRRRLSPEASEWEIALAHPIRLINELDIFAAAGGGRYDPETLATPETPRMVRAAAGSVVQAVRDGLAGEAPVSACLARPGSHHAGVERPMGTCFVNNLAVGALFALENGARRVAIVDLDAHHGNGTEEIFRTRGDVLCISIHEYPFYPGSGGSNHNPLCLNLPIPTGAGRQMLAPAWERAMRALRAYEPEVILVEASFDAHEMDIISTLSWTDEDYFGMYRDLAGFCRQAGIPLVLEIGAAATETAFRRGLGATVAGINDAW